MCFIDVNILSHFVLLYSVRIVHLGGHHLGKSCSWGVEDMLEMSISTLFHLLVSQTCLCLFLVIVYCYCNKGVVGGFCF